MPWFAHLPCWLRGGVPAYPWRRIDPVPVALLREPLSECRVALVTTAGAVPHGEPAFDPQRPGGDGFDPVVGARAALTAPRRHQRTRTIRPSGPREGRHTAPPP